MTRDMAAGGGQRQRAGQSSPRGSRWGTSERGGTARCAALSGGRRSRCRLWVAQRLVARRCCRSGEPVRGLTAGCGRAGLFPLASRPSAQCPDRQKVVKVLLQVALCRRLFWGPQFFNCSCSAYLTVPVHLNNLSVVCADGLPMPGYTLAKPPPDAPQHSRLHLHRRQELAHGCACAGSGLGRHRGRRRGRAGRGDGSGGSSGADAAADGPADAAHADPGTGCGPKPWSCSLNSLNSNRMQRQRFTSPQTLYRLIPSLSPSDSAFATGDAVRNLT